MKKTFRPNFISLETSLVSLPSSLNPNPELSTVGGFALVLDKDNRVVGTLTDGDIRRFDSGRSRNEQQISARDLMNSNFIRVSSDHSPIEMASQVLEQLSKRQLQNEFPITYIPVLTHSGQYESLIHISHLSPFLEELTRQIVIIGQGFVGITMAMAMVNKGLKVLAIEHDEIQVNNIRRLMPNVQEPQLREILQANIGKNYFIENLSLSALNRNPLFGRRIMIICVGTPRVGDKIVLDELFASCEELAQSIQLGDMIVVRSTVPVGTTRKIARIIEKTSDLRAGVDFNLVYAPERTVEGNAINEVIRLPQLVAGLSETCSKAAVTFFSPWVANVISMENLEACELAKLSSNAYRDVTFAFSNEIAKIASLFNVDINKMIANANSGYSRNAIPNPSPGVGGPCLTKDSYMLSDSFDPSVIGAARQVNENMINFCVKRITELSRRYGNTVLVIGIAFKGNPPTNDVRHSTSIEIIRGLQQATIEVSCLDAVVNETQIKKSGLIPFRDSKKDIKMICILNNHPNNKEILQALLIEEQKNTNGKIAIFDPWNCLDSGDLPSNFKLEISTLSTTREIHT